MSLRSSLLILLLVLGTVITQDEDYSPVLTLTQQNFEDALKDHPFLFVKFYTPWCTHCKKLAPIFIEMGHEWKDTHPEVTLAEVDLDEHKSIQAKYRVQSYPTLIFFRHGQPINFGGSRTKEFMTSWVAKKKLDPIIKIQQSQLTDLQNAQQVSIVFFGEIESPQANILLGIAKSDDYNMYYAVSGSNRIPNSVEIIRPFGQTIRRDVVDYNIRNWINLYDRPFVYSFDDRASSQVFSEKRNALILFTPQDDTAESVSEAFRQAAQDVKETQKKKFIFIEIKPETEHYTSLPDHLKVDPALRKIVYIKGAEKLKYLYPEKHGPITSSTVLTFMKAVQGKKVKKYKLQDETRPNPPPSTEEL